MSAPELSPILLDPFILVADPNTVIARVVQRLTVYTVEPLTYGRGLASDILKTFLQFVSQRTRWYTTSRMDTWRRVKRHDLPMVLPDSRPVPARHRCRAHADPEALGLTERPLSRERRSVSVTTCPPEPRSTDPYFMSMSDVDAPLMDI